MSGMHGRVRVSDSENGLPTSISSCFQRELECYPEM